MPYLASIRPSHVPSAFCASGESCSKNIADRTFSGLRQHRLVQLAQDGVSNHSGGTSVAALGSQARSLISTRSRSRSAATSKPALRRLTGATGRPRLGVGASGGAGGAAALVGGLLAEHLPAHTRPLGDRLQVEIAGDRVRRRPDRRQQPVERLALVLHALEPALPLQELDLPLEQIDRVFEDRLQRGGAALSHQRVGVLARAASSPPAPARRGAAARRRRGRWPGGPPGRCRRAAWPCGANRAQQPGLVRR